MTPPPDLPPHIHAHIERLRVDAVAAEIVQALRAAGIPTILLKGASLASWLYPEGARTYTDVDLLVAPSDLVAAERVLARSGFVSADPPAIPGDRPRHANAWVRHSDAAAVDLHRSIIGAQTSPEKVWEALSPRTEQMLIQTVEVDVLDHPALCVQIALHAAHHGTSVLKPMADLKRAIANATEPTWAEAASVAEELQALGAFCQGVSLLPEGVRLLRDLSIAAPPTVEAAVRAEGTPAALGLQWLMEEKSLHRRGLLLLRKAVPPPAYVRDWWPPARRGRLLLLVGYIRRLVFLAKQLRPATRSVREARQEADEHE